MPRLERLGARVLVSILALVLLSAPLVAGPHRKAPPRLFFERLEPAPPPASAERGDTLWLFAASGPGAYGMPGTFEQGYTFDGPGGTAEPAGWHGVDLSAQTGLWWHVAGTDVCAGHGTDMSAALPFDPGDTVNDYALWCGLETACGWVHVPGYGNEWDQTVSIDLGDISLTGSLDVSFAVASDFEGYYTDERLAVGVEMEWGGTLHYASIYYNNGPGLLPFAVIEQVLDATAYPADTVFKRLFFHFRSDRGASDQDGGYLTDVGAVWLDNIRVLGDGLELIAVDFEDGLEPVALSFEIAGSAGDFAALYHDLFQEDICVHNSTHVWAFFDLNTPPDGSSPGYPGAIPFTDPCVDNVVQSHLLEVTDAGDPLALGANSHLLLNYWSYMDLAIGDLVFFYWDVAAWIEGEECPRQFENDNFIYYGDYKRWIDTTKDITEALLESAGDDIDNLRGIVVRLGVIDMGCEWGYGEESHNATPYFDRVRVGIIEDEPHAWEVSDALCFQDGFPAPATGKVRLDPAVNVEQYYDPVATVGDSAVVGLNMDLAGGIAQSFNPDAGEMRPDLRLWWRVTAGPHAGMIDPAMADPDGADGIFSPYVGTEIFDGDAWGLIQADSAAWQGQVADHQFAFDFADAYFEAGDVVEYFYRAEAVDGTVSTRPERALSADPDLREHYLVRCLPTAGVSLLLVEDDEDLLPAWREAFLYGGYDRWDTYTTLAPSSGLNNGLARSATPELLGQYAMIVWDSGDLPDYTIANGPPHDKVFDTDLLDAWLRDTDHAVGLWVMGNMVASDLTNADPFLGGVLGATLVSEDLYYDDLTGIMVPRVFAVPPLLGGGDPWFWAYGGCPHPENFNLVQPLGALTEVTHAWEEDAGTGAVAGVLNRDPDGDGTELNAAGHTSRAMLNAFSYGVVRDGGYGLPQGVDYARAAVGDVLTLLFEAGPTGPPDDVPEAPGVTRFAGAWPNPFNPATTVRFSLAEAGPARVTVHDVAGRLVRTLHDGPAPAGETELVWDGRDEQGCRQASGVYLLRFQAAGAHDQRKLVLLK